MVTPIRSLIAAVLIFPITGGISLEQSRGPSKQQASGQLTGAASRPQPQPVSAPLGNVPVEIPPQIKLGLRLQAMRDKTTYIPTVVIVTEATSYIQAISAWTPQVRWPVLIDDGSAQSREDIARFVRGYSPTSVVRWSAPNPADQPQGGGQPGHDPAKPSKSQSSPVALPQGAASFTAGQNARISAAIQRVWGVPNPGTDATALTAQWRSAKHESPGIVVAAPNDPAWTAALPLAAAWGQPLYFLAKSPEGNIDHSMTISAADGMEREVEHFAAMSGTPWEGLGSGIDSITLCVNGPERIAVDNKEFLALSDRLGRKGEGVKLVERWAWTGHIFGSASRSAYMAMSSLFIAPTRAWLFDGYPDKQPWNTYDVTKAAENFKARNLQCDVMDTPKQGAIDWRTVAAKPVAADIILVNSKGNNDFFDLEPGQCKPGDIPFLQRPAALHFVHSWSLLFPGKRETVGGRWLERGVFVYCGSVHEPYLQAFNPTPVVAGRLMSGAPFAASVRVEGGPVWKIAVLGDPLYLPGPPPKRENTPLPLAFTQPVGEDLKTLLTDGKFEAGALALKLLGRDADLAKLAAGLLDAKPEEVSAAFAREAILPAFRAGDQSLVQRLFEKLPVESAKTGEYLDALWLSGYPVLLKAESGELPRLLREHIRADQFEHDVRTLAMGWGRRFGQAGVSGLYAELRQRYSSKDQLAVIDLVEGK